MLGLNACTTYVYLYFISYPSILLIGSILLIAIGSLQHKILVLLSVMLLNFPIQNYNIIANYLSKSNLMMVAHTTIFR